MIKKEDVYNVVMKFLEQLNQEAGLAMEISLDTTIIGENSAFDSMAFLDLIGMIEDWIDEEFGLFVSLASDDEDFEPGGPFGNVNNMVEHLVNLINKETMACSDPPVTVET